MKRLPLCLLLALIALPVSAFADEEAPVPGPRALDEAKPTDAAPAAKKPAPAAPFDPAHFDLLPLSDAHKLKLYAEHPALATRLTVLGGRGKRLNDQLARRKNKMDAGSKKLRRQIGQIAKSIGQTLQNNADVLRPYGITPEVLELVKTAPSDGLYRVDRYAHSLVLSLDLTEKQRALFERIVPQVNGAYYALFAQRRRMNLVARQSEVEKEDAQRLAATIDAELRWNDKRFWMLCDYVLDDAQRLALKLRLPTRFQRIQNGIEHLYQLQGITPSQGARAKSILTEFEAEAAPDQALTKRIQAQLRDRSLDAEKRKALQKERGEAGKRLQGLQLYISKAFKELLTERQYDLYRAIPPRLSHVDRRRDFRYVFDGMPFKAEQTAKLNGLKRAYRKEQADMQKKLGEIRGKSADFGSDSPQMEMMQMEMAGVAAEGYALQRKALGQVFLNILTPSQVSGWVLGWYGKVR